MPRSASDAHLTDGLFWAAVPDATAALVITAGVFAWLYARVESGASMTLQVMPDLADADRYWMYWLC
ncbi:hypothetical protein GCM10023079_19910 [Streptomyces chitinivorans]